MYTFEEKTQLVKELLPMVNGMAAAQRVGKILCEKPITHADLMALSDLELEQLKTAVQQAQTVKKQEMKRNDYGKHFEVKSEHPSKQHKIIC